MTLELVSTYLFHCDSGVRDVQSLAAFDVLRFSTEENDDTSERLSYIYLTHQTAQNPSPRLALSKSISHSRASGKLFEPITINTHILYDLLLLLARHRGTCRLNFQHTAVCIRTLSTWERIHSLLERIILPAKQVVTMLSIPGASFTLATEILATICIAKLTRHQNCTQTAACRFHTTYHSCTCLYPT
jgi:hypothetical protein